MKRFSVSKSVGLLVHLLVVSVGLTVVCTAHATAVQWASTVSNANIADASNALGKPDGVTANFVDFNPTTIETATFAGFGGGDNINYDATALAALLGIDPVLLAQADLIAFEYNGSGGGNFETSDWIFSDGTHSLTVAYTYGVPPTDPAIIALQTISNSAYASFFGFTNPVGNVGNFASILFDIDGNSAVDLFSSTFSATVSARGSGDPPDSPEPDAIGRIGVASTSIPEPGTLLLLSTGCIGLLGYGWRRKHHTRKKGLDSIDSDSPNKSMQPTR